MKNIFLLIGILSCASQAYGQVGINTDDPSATLDVNGSIRVRAFKSLEDMEAKKIVGIDEDGNFIEVAVEDNLVLKSNEIRSVGEFEFISDPFAIDIAVGDDVDFIILPGEPNDDKSVIRITSTVGDIEITGIKAATNGQKIRLYPTSGSLVLSSNDTASLAANRILSHNSGNVTVQQYQMIQLMYDSVEGGWIIMSRH